MPTGRSCRVALLVSVLCAAPLASLIPGAAVAADADAQEVSRYALTEAGLARYTAATLELRKLAAGARIACSDATGSSLARMAAQLDATPGVKAALQRAGMTTREYLVFSFSLLQTGLAAWGLDQPGGKLPPGVSMDNVKFYRAHQAAIGKLGPVKQDECGESGDERDDAS